MNGNKLELVPKIEYFGVIIDKYLKFDKNVDYVCRKFGKKVNVLRRIGNELSGAQNEQLYKSIIQHHYTYCVLCICVIFIK